MPAEGEGALAWHPLPGAAWCTAALIFMAAAAALDAPMPELAFRSDGSPVSWLSSAQLWALFAVALQLGTQRLLPVRLAAWLALAMAWMAFDEQFMFHEKWKFGCPLGPPLCAPPWLREAPMALVGLLGLATAAWLHRALPPGGARLTLWAGIGIGVGALVLDQTEAPRLLAPYEEGFEVMAEALFGAALLGLRRRG